MRVIAGELKGRRIDAPKGTETRPTSDFVRETAFNLIGPVDGATVLDLYAGSGALGLEAASRGAVGVTAVESDRRTAAVISANARTLGFAVRVLAQPVARVLAGPPEAPFDLVLADPPYPLSNEEVTADLQALLDHGWLSAEAAVVLERSARSVEPQWPVGLGPVRHKRYGETVLWYLRRDSEPRTPGSA